MGERAVNADLMGGRRRIWRYDGRGLFEVESEGCMGMRGEGRVNADGVDGYGHGGGMGSDGMRMGWDGDGMGMGWDGRGRCSGAGGTFWVGSKGSRRT